MGLVVMARVATALWERQGQTNFKAWA
ncbi:hypothetical protein CCACVL1_19402 [Corchorus capsularis]|uniref:Uncharacterized protein n=1 Tax=Corchorus capsularis TaxID=210143 RepID=A0A1R3HGZ5_COCAP|nr:hypothetical protein CCACVL1_19402 [Corchorus capsularis]